nr:outer membrane protein assembly factor BamD [Kofleriaceae bacterium]
MKLTALAVVAMAACGGSPAAPPPARPELSNTAPARQDKLGCSGDQLLLNASHAYDCAEDAVGRGDYPVAATRAELVMSHFPYSKYAVDAEELRADIHYDAGEWLQAYRGYDAWLSRHPKNPRVDAVRHKRSEASDRAVTF